MATSRRRPLAADEAGRRPRPRRTDVTVPDGGGRPARPAPTPDPPAGPRPVGGGDRRGGRRWPASAWCRRRSRPRPPPRPRRRRRGPGPPGRGHLLVGLLSGGHRDGRGDHRLPDQLHDPGGRRRHDQRRAGGTSRGGADRPSRRGGPPVGHVPPSTRPTGLGPGQQRLVVHLRRREAWWPTRWCPARRAGARRRARPGRPPSGPSPAVRPPAGNSSGAGVVRSRRPGRGGQHHLPDHDGAGHAPGLPGPGRSRRAGWWWRTSAPTCSRRPTSPPWSAPRPERW